MRYSLTLPIALAALATAPALSAQDATPPSDTTATTTQAPPPADPATPAPTEPAATPPTDVDTDPAEQPEAATPATPAESATPAQPATMPATPAAPATGTTPASKPMLTGEQKVAYDAWPADARTYFDGLPAPRQEIFLRLKDEDKLKIVALTPAQQASTWTSLEKQDADQKAAAPKTM